MNENVIKFYKDLGLMDDKMEEYLNKRIHFIFEDEKDCLAFVGCFPIEKDGLLKDIRVSIPYGEKLKR